MARRGGIGTWGRMMSDQSGSDPRNQPYPGSHIPTAPPPPRGGDLPQYTMGENRTFSGRLGAFASRIGRGASAFATDYAERNPAPWGGPPKTSMDVGMLAGGGAAALTGYQAAKWAFRGRRSTETFSLAHEQNLYGGVQRDAIPTARIAMWNRSGGETSAQSRFERRRDVLNEQELYLPAAGGEGVSGEVPGGLPPGTGVDPVTMPSRAAGFDQFGSEDPLFNQNTGRGYVNPTQFNPHQRATSGLT